MQIETQMFLCFLAGLSTGGLVTLVLALAAGWGK